MGYNYVNVNLLSPAISLEGVDVSPLSVAKLIELLNIMIAFSLLWLDIINAFSFSSSSNLS